MVNLATKPQGRSVTVGSVVSCVVFLGALGCSSNVPRPVDVKVDGPEPLAPDGTTAGPSSSSDRDPSNPQPIEIIVRNGSASPVRLSVTDGEGGHLAIADVEGNLGRIELDLPQRCECLCGTQCAACPKATPKEVTLEPGVERRVLWNGGLRRPGSGDVVWEGRRLHRCLDRFKPPPGRYLLRACGNKESGCTTTEFELPATSPVVLTFPATPEVATSCDVPASLLRRAGRALLSTIGQARDAKCDPTTTRCVLKASAVQQQPAGSCVMVATPKGEHLMVEAVIWDEEGKRKGYSVYMDPQAVDVEFVIY